MARHPHSRDLRVRIAYGDLRVDLTAEGASYSPDALDDMNGRALQAFAEAWRCVEPFERFAASCLEVPYADDGPVAERLHEGERED